MVGQLSVADLGLHDGEEEALDVLDLPQLYAKPSARLLLSTLLDLKSDPPSWESSPRSGNSRQISGTSTPIRKQRKVKSEGVPAYLTRIISNPLVWIEDDEQKEQIWEKASQELSARSGRTAMGDITRSFSIPLSSGADLSGANRSLSTEQVLEIDTDEFFELLLHEPALTADNLGLKTWASSYLLAKRLWKLQNQVPTLPQHANVLELGSGTGLVGMTAACVFQRHAVLTDLPDIVPNLQRNAHANAAVTSSYGGSTCTAILDWSQPDLFGIDEGGGNNLPNTFPLILAADAVYMPEHPKLLAKALDYHLSKDSAARFIVELPLRDSSAQERQDFRDRLADIGLVVLVEGTEVGLDDWSNGRDDELAEVHCWWSVWSWKS